MHNYIKKLTDLDLANRFKGKVCKVEALHDDWCRIYKKGECNCDPEIVVQIMDDEGNFKRVDAQLRDGPAPKLLIIETGKP